MSEVLLEWAWPKNIWYEAHALANKCLLYFYFYFVGYFRLIVMVCSHFNQGKRNDGDPQQTGGGLALDTYMHTL